VRICATLADSTAFNLAIVAVVLANAIVLGLEEARAIEAARERADRIMRRAAWPPVSGTVHRTRHAALRGASSSAVATSALPSPAG
jgi:hypothetical protein